MRNMAGPAYSANSLKIKVLQNYIRYFVFTFVFLLTWIVSLTVLVIILCVKVLL